MKMNDKDVETMLKECRCNINNLHLRYKKLKEKYDKLKEDYNELNNKFEELEEYFEFEYEWNNEYMHELNRYDTALEKACEKLRTFEDIIYRYDEPNSIAEWKKWCLGEEEDEKTIYI